MILFISDSRESIPIVQAIRREGVPAEIYVHDPRYRSSFDGILPKVSLGGLEAALKRCQVVVIDITLPNHETPQDASLMLKFGVSVKSPGVFGPVSDKLRKTHLVISGTKWAENIELDREDGIDLARKCGFSIPDYKIFHSCKEGVKFLQTPEGQKRRWVIKPFGNKDLDRTYPETFKGEALDILQHSLPAQYGDKLDFMLQAFVEDGIEISSELWWDGEEFLNANRTLEVKKLCAENKGPATGSQGNAIWMCENQDSVVFKQVKHMAPYLKKSGYLGPIDANCILTKDGKAWFLEWTPRPGWSALYCLLRFIPKGQISNFFINGFRAVFKKGFVSSQLVSLWPYPCDEAKKTLERQAKGNLINHRLQDLDDFWLQDVYRDDEGKLRIAGACGIVGVMTCRGNTFEESTDKLYRRLDKLQITGNLQWRPKSDHLQQFNDRLKKLKSWNLEVW